jgi:hypothetical protein
MFIKLFNMYSHLYLILPLLSSLYCPCAFCYEDTNKFIVNNISFGVIEPPVVAQKDITVLAPTSNQQIEGKPLECSGLAWLNGYLLIASDRHEHLLFTCSIDLNNMVIGTPQQRILVHNEQNLLNDVESMTLLQKNDGLYLYMMCSLSNAPNAQPIPQRRHLFCCTINQITLFVEDNSNIFSVETIREQLETCFKKINVQPYYTYDADYTGENKNTYRWGNVEGITFTPDGKYLLCGMRNPLFDGAAIVAAISGMSYNIQPIQQKSLKIIDLFLLDLELRGISDLSWDPVTKGYLITAAKSNGPRLDPDKPFPPNTLDSALFWWSGLKIDKPILVARIPDMTIEAVCRLGNSRYIVLGSDEGDVSEGRTARQSILTVLEFSGIPK